MIVKCIKKLLDNWEDSVEFTGSPDQNFLEADKEYIVYGITILDNEFWYYIIEDDMLENRTCYPVWYNQKHFEIKDQTLPSGWVFKISENPGHGEPYLSFPEWVNEANFYENLIDDINSHENRLFQEYRANYHSSFI